MQLDPALGFKSKNNTNPEPVPPTVRISDDLDYTVGWVGRPVSEATAYAGLVTYKPGFLRLCCIDSDKTADSAKRVFSYIDGASLLSGAAVVQADPLELTPATVLANNSIHRYVDTIIIYWLFVARCLGDLGEQKKN